MKSLLIILTSLLLVSCFTEVSVGEERLYCDNCYQPRDPFEIDTNDYKIAKVIAKKGDYVQFVMNGDTISDYIRNFNYDTFTEDHRRIGIHDGWATFITIVIIILGSVFILSIDRY